METEQFPTMDIDLQVQSIILAASQHDCDTLKKLLRGSSSAPANVQDPETGFTPLHAAIAACEPENATMETVDGHFNGDEHQAYTEEVPGLPSTSTDVDAATDTLRFLLQNGAIWNELDRNNETPGCLALRLGLKKPYEIMVDAGVRAEILFSRLGEYERLADEDDGDNREDEDLLQAEDEDITNADAKSDLSIRGRAQESTAEGDNRQPVVDGETPALNSESYLNSRLTFRADGLLDDETNGVMMSWEAEIMKRTTDILLPAKSLRVLNIGHGMGIIDNLFQAKVPTSHHIIEAHPDVISNMKKNGWYNKSGVSVHEGKWQDVVPSLIEQGLLFDAIYFDTFAEDYTALRKLFDEYIIGLLDDNGRWSFFNGLGADRQICYDVYAKIVEMDLLEAGFDNEWDILSIPSLDSTKTWDGVKRPYFKLEEYKLPIIRFLGS